LLDFLAIFRRSRPDARNKARKRKSSGAWRVELEKIGGLVKRAPAAKTIRKGDLTPTPAPNALQVEPLRDEFLLNDAMRQQGSLVQHPLHPDTIRQDGYRQETFKETIEETFKEAFQEAFRPPRPPRPQSPPGVVPGFEAPVAPPASQPQRFTPPRPRRPDPVVNQAPAGYLAAHNVEKSFGARKVVKGASLFVRRGEAVGLLGPNGAGKTTIFYMITGLGKVELDGNDVTPLPMYQRARLGVGYLPQEASIFRGLNVEDNIRSVLEVVERDPKKRERELDSLLDEFNIARLRKSPSIALSGGERRRCEIARALASRPSYVLLDEPFAGIDPIAVGDIQVLVRHLTQRGIGVLITDHNVRETLGLTDRAYIIYSGEVLMEGRAEDIVNNPDVRRLYLGEDFRL
jgi:lipopolysaccharide export system ATP-binding protein